MRRNKGLFFNLLSNLVYSGPQNLSGVSLFDQIINELTELIFSHGDFVAIRFNVLNSRKMYIIVVIIMELANIAVLVF